MDMPRAADVPIDPTDLPPEHTISKRKYILHVLQYMVFMVSEQDNPLSSRVHLSTPKNPVLLSILVTNVMKTPHIKNGYKPPYHP